MNLSLDGVRGLVFGSFQLLVVLARRDFTSLITYVYTWYMLWLKHISGILGQFTSFCKKKLVLLIILLPLDKILRFFVLLFKNV